MLINHTYRTSEYEKFKRKDGEKIREIYKLPYFPDRICQWALLQVIEPYIIRGLISTTYSAIPGRGIHKALKDVTKAINKDYKNCQYCLKLDIHHFYPSINHIVLKRKFRKLFKDEEVLWLLDEIIDSISTANEEDVIDKTDLPHTGIPIGNYLSQYCGNFYLSDFDHWIKEQCGVKHYFRYMDDMLIFSDSKETLWQLKPKIFAYLKDNLRLTVKSNWQIFPTNSRGIDFVGYRMFKGYSLLRKSCCKKFKKKMIKISGLSEITSYSDWCSLNSYKGWLIWCNSWRLRNKYLDPLQEKSDKYYNTFIKKGEVNEKVLQSS